MKKLGKLTINPEKVIKNDELVNLRGGYGGCAVILECVSNFNIIGQLCVEYCREKTANIDICHDSGYSQADDVICW